MSELQEKVKKLLEYKFNNKEEPIVIVGPDGTRKTMLRVYAYGGRIGRIGKTTTHLASPAYAKLEYLDEAQELREILGDKSKSMEMDCDDYLKLILKAAEKRFGERKIQTEIVKQHMKKEPNSDWCIVDMEYTVSTKDENGKKEIFKPDLVVFDKKEGFGLIELKYNGKSTDNLEKHYDDFKKIDSNKERDIIKELKRRCEYLSVYGLIDSDIYKKISDIYKKIEKPNTSQKRIFWQGFLFVGEEPEDARREVQKLEINDERCRFAFYSDVKKMDLSYNAMKNYKDFIGQ